MINCNSLGMCIGNFILLVVQTTWKDIHTKTPTFIMSFFQSYMNLKSSHNNGYLMTKFCHIHFFGHMGIQKIERKTTFHDAGKHSFMFWHCNSKKFYFHSKKFNENNFLIKTEEVQNFDYCNTPLSILHLGGTFEYDSCNYRNTSSIFTYYSVNKLVK
jgi:hypothetical protein